MPRTYKQFKDEQRQFAAKVKMERDKATDWRDVICPPSLHKLVAMKQRVEAERKKAMQRDGFR